MTAAELEDIEEPEGAKEGEEDDQCRDRSKQAH